MQNQGLPLPYGIENLYNSNRHPSQLHANTGLSRYFQRYFIQKIMSVFEWKNLPEDWSVDYFLYSIYLWGYVAIVETKEFGVIPQWCTLRGRDVFYRPTNAVISNPLLRGLMDPKIGVDCALIRMQPDYGGAYDIISYYADLMALCAQTLSINIINSKLSFIGIATNKASAEGMKKAGIIDDTGTFTKEEWIKNGFPLWKPAPMNRGEEPLTISQDDIHELLLAKSAVRSGIEILIKKAGITPAKVYLAGGFGSALSADDAASIGLFPEVLSNRITAVGNTSLKGAMKFLKEASPKTRERLSAIRTMSSEIVLADEDDFERLYISHLTL